MSDVNITVTHSPIAVTVTSEQVSIPVEVNVVATTASDGGSVTSVAGRSGAVTLTSADLTDTTAAGRALLDDASASDQRTTLGLGNSSTRNVGSSTGTVAAGDDARLSDARTPTSHTHAPSEITAGGASTGQTLTWNGLAWAPATPTSGKLVNRWVATSTTAIGTTNILPIDDTIPQSTEGAEMITVSVTPSSASNMLKVTVSGWYRVSGASFVGCALFVGAAADASASRPLLASNNVVSPFDLVFWINGFSGTQTLRFRMGTDRNTVTLQFLNISGATYFGSTDPAMILVEEIAP